MINPIEKIQDKIDETIYGYDRNEFLPIFEEGELANQSAFVAYKLKRGMQHIGNVAVAGLEALDAGFEYLHSLEQ